LDLRAEDLHHYGRDLLLSGPDRDVRFFGVQLPKPVAKRPHIGRGALWEQARHVGTREPGDHYTLDKLVNGNRLTRAMALRPAPVHELTPRVLPDGHGRAVVADPAPVDQGPEPLRRVARRRLAGRVGEERDQRLTQVIWDVLGERHPLQYSAHGRVVP